MQEVHTGDVSAKPAPVMEPRCTCKAQTSADTHASPGAPRAGGGTSAGSTGRLFPGRGQSIGAWADTTAELGPPPRQGHRVTSHEAVPHSLYSQGETKP